MSDLFFRSELIGPVRVLRLLSPDGTNRLTLACVSAFTDILRENARSPEPLVVTGNDNYFSAGADLREIRRLDGVAARDFSRRGQQLMDAIESFPAPVYAVVSGYCLGGGLDLALACHHRIATPSALFGHRGASLGLVTGWGGTQRLPRLIGKAAALSMFMCAGRVDAEKALQFGLIDGIAEDPVADAVLRIETGYAGRKR